MLEPFFWCPICDEPHLVGDAPSDCPLTVRGGSLAGDVTVDDQAAAIDVQGVRVGMVMGERYALEERIGEGAMGEVFRARDLQERRDVALKVMVGDYGSSSVSKKRFEREARIMAAIEHPGVVRVLDFGMYRGACAYLVMELLKGQTVGEALNARYQLGIEESCAITCQVLSTLSSVHEQGYVHRDLKPANVFLVEQGDTTLVKLLDFGLSRETRRSAVRLTRPGAVLGTPHYMSPDLITGADPCAGSDVYAVALLFYEMLTGDLPIEFDDDPLVQVFAKILGAPRRHPRMLRPSIPVELGEIVMHAVDPRRGYANAYEFLAAIDGTQGGVFLASDLAPTIAPPSE